MDLLVFLKIQDNDSSSIIATAVYVKESGMFRQVKELTYNRTTNNLAKASTFVNDVTTALYGSKLTADENENMLLILTFTSDIFLLCREKAFFFFTLKRPRKEKNTIIHFFTTGLKRASTVFCFFLRVM